MTEFFEALRSSTVLQNALLAGLLSSVACGVVGSYVVTKRISYIAGALAHCVLGGLGMARYLEIVWGWEWITPLHGALFAALIAVGIIGFVTLRVGEREDTIIGAVWAIGMAIGILFIQATPGYAQDLEGYLFGNILFVSAQDLWLIVILDILVVTVSLVFYKPLLAICFDEEFARLRGVRVELYYLLLLGLVAVTVVLLLSLVGIILVIALLTLPAAIANRFSATLGWMMLLATVFCGVFTTSGLALSYGPELPVGATIIMVTGVAYLGVTLLSAVLRR